MFWKIVAIVSFVAGLLVGALFLQPRSASSPPAANRPASTTTICPPAGGGQIDTSVI